MQTCNLAHLTILEFPYSSIQFCYSTKNHRNIQLLVLDPYNFPFQACDDEKISTIQLFENFRHRI